MRVRFGPLILLALAASPLRAQSLEDDLNQLFIFGEGDEALHLGGSAASENPGISAETIEAMRVRFGLDKPWYVQYGIYLRNVLLHFDFGQSFARHQPVFDVISEGFTNTLILAGAAAFITWVLAIPLGVLAAVKQHSWLDRTLSFVAFIWLSVPESSRLSVNI